MKQPLQITGRARLAGYCFSSLIAAPAVADPPKYKLANPARVLGAAFVLAIVSLIATSVAHAEPFAYVTNRLSNNVSVIDTASNAVITTVAVGGDPIGVAITPDGAFAYVANGRSDNVSVIDTASNAVTATVTVGDFPWGVAITPEPLAIEVRIDIKPGSNKNPINLRSKGNIAVAILSTGKFDATQVNWETVTFGPDEATEIHQHSHLKDVDKDGDLDFLLHFNIRETGIECGDKTATLTGETFNGEAFTGSDKITVKCH
jgi:YVTN family beta-propeller protein